ncbi:Long-chain-alcohol oxidase FAO2 [Cyphellophora attinorum]|uniref:Long-chain-alcohol oxidase n=1 Tax=Cyphellophora attinorum TaxID=1664694 RepID=A0A0N0NJV7_9EURO|nr:Long-chain-alcohol oxidase FAO2 [Phialophora attinorum]KPI37089.1 Long-chain-alcohol oxidase FAO2 [Phialophora attinorum]
MDTAVDVQRVTSLAPLASPLAPIPDDDIFTDVQWKTLTSILEVFIPSLAPASSDDKSALHPDDYEKYVEDIQLYVPPDVSRKDIETYLAESVTSIPGLKDNLRRRFAQSVAKPAVAGLSTVLGTLNTTAGSLLLTGSTTPIHQQPIAERTTIIRKWSQSYIPTLRKLHNTFSGLSRQWYIHESKSFPKVIGYKGHYADVERRPTYAFKFHDFTASDSPTTLETDVVVIGSGPGSGAVTNRLAAAGMKCIVIDKGYHWNSDHFPMKHSDAQEHLYENYGAVVSDDGGLATAAASTFGGGGTVNWSATLQPPAFVRKQWQDEEGLNFAVGQAYQESLDYVCDKMGAARANDHEALAKIKHNYANELLLEGARKVGLEVKVVPQNTGGRVHDCGHCHLGCPSCTKQGPANLWFPEAAEKGAEFIVGFWAEKILFADDGKTAVGVKGQWTSQDREVTKEVTIKAKRVIVASGTFQSPLLLKRSGLTNPWIGKNFHVHPVWYIFATMPDRIDPWKGGGLLTSVVTGLRHGTGDYHGPVIEICMGMPTQTGLPLAVSSKATGEAAAAQYKVDLAKLGHTVGLFSMVRDKDSGEIYADKHNPRMAHMKYTTSQRDKEQIVVGQVEAARIAYAMGAREISVEHPDVDAFVRSSTATQEINDEAFELWLNDVKTKGLTANSEPIMMHSAHQFGTCKMSANKDRGVVDGQGRVWGYNNLWVADSSVLPTATGVNPMVSTMGTADWIARGIERSWQEERRG